MANTIGTVQSAGAVGATRTSAPASASDYLAGKTDQVLGSQQSSSPVSVRVTGDIGDVKQQQAAFTQAMAAKGIKADNPPTETQLKNYFATFNSKEHRAEAGGELDRYNQAFNSYGDASYPSQTVYQVNGKTTDTKPIDPSLDYKVTNDAKGPSSWADVSSNRQTGDDGRKVLDCKGYAYVAQDLLGSAGYHVQQVATASSKDGSIGGHAMAVATDPDSKQVSVVSNDQTFSGGSTNQLLQKGYDYSAGGVHTPALGGFHYGDTVAHADAQFGFDQPQK